MADAVEALTRLRDELFAGAVELESTKRRRELSLAPLAQREADAIGASARAVRAIGARVEEMMREYAEEAEADPEAQDHRGSEADGGSVEPQGQGPVLRAVPEADAGAQDDDAEGRAGL